MKIIYFLTWAIFTNQLFAMYNNTPRQLDCPLPRSRQINPSPQPHYQNNVQCNNIETNNEINATNINIANPIKQDNEINSHKYSYEEIEKQRKKYYKINPKIEIKTEEDREEKIKQFIENAKSYNESAQKEKNLFFYIKKRFAYFQAATLEQDPKQRIEYIKNEGDEYIKAKNLSTCPKERKILLGFAICAYLRAAVEANIEQLYEIETNFYLKVLETEGRPHLINFLLNCAKFSFFQVAKNNKNNKSPHDIERDVYEKIEENAKTSNTKTNFLKTQRKILDIAENNSENYKDPNIQNIDRIISINDIYNIYGLRYHSPIKRPIAQIKNNISSRKNTN